MIPRLIFEMESTGDDDLEGMLNVFSTTECEGVQVMVQDYCTDWVLSEPWLYSTADFTPPVHF